MDNQIIELLKQPWPWYVGGVFVGLTVPILLMLGNKTFGISSSLRHICAACLPTKIPFFNYDWKKESWNLFFVGGTILGGFLAHTFLSDPNSILIAESTKTQLRDLGVHDFTQMMPADLFSWEALFSVKGLVFTFFGGFLVGFGTRWAGGCTSGHSIMGLSNLQWPSLIATCCFLIGGFLMTWFGLPFLLSL